jgi:hypothetical protein
VVGDGDVRADAIKAIILNIYNNLDNNGMYLFQYNVNNVLQNRLVVLKENSLNQ